MTNTEQVSLVYKSYIILLQYASGINYVMSNKASTWFFSYLNISWNH